MHFKFQINLALFVILYIKFNVMAMYQSMKEATTYTLALFMKISSGVDTSRIW